VLNSIESISYTVVRYTPAGEWTLAMECADTPRRLKAQGIESRRIVGLRLERTETALNVTIELERKAT
jgi:hypothetical protein